MECPSCGRAASSEDKFCSECGTPLTEYPWGKYCKYCNLRGKRDSKGKSYCVDCEGPLGREIEEEQLPSSEVKMPPTPLRSWAPLLIFGFIVSLLLVGFLFHKWQVYAEAKSSEAQRYLKFLESSVDRYKEITEEMGEIGSLVYTPESEGFDEKRAEAELRLEKLERTIQGELKVIKEKKCPSILRSEREHLERAFKGLLSKDIKELRIFIEASDPDIVAMMMRGDISQTPFQKAVAPSDYVKREMDEVIKGMYEKGY